MKGAGEWLVMVNIHLRSNLLAMLCIWQANFYMISVCLEGF